MARKLISYREFETICRRCRGIIGTSKRILSLLRPKLLTDLFGASLLILSCERRCSFAETGGFSHTLKITEDLSRGKFRSRSQGLKLKGSWYVPVRRCSNWCPRSGSMATRRPAPRNTPVEPGGTSSGVVGRRVLSLSTVEKSPMLSTSQRHSLSISAPHALTSWICAISHQTLLRKWTRLQLP